MSVEEFPKYKNVKRAKHKGIILTNKFYFTP